MSPKGKFNIKQDLRKDNGKINRRERRVHREIIVNLLTLSVSDSVIAEQIDITDQSLNYGTIFFGSVFLSAPIKIILDFLTHFKRPLQKSSPE
ncbi:hypothetical protein BV375_11990 [Nostoc sp. 106C]|nr:hypothetical protein BV375_11990 [Nostoc sp. 106C]